MESATIGRIAAIYRYPVKSMAAEPLEAAELSWQGLAGDRRWAFIRPGLERSDFPWLTIRERADLRDHLPRFTDPAGPDDSPVLVRTPGGDELDVSDPALAAALGDGVRVIKQNRGVFDVMPLSVITTQAIAALGELVGRELEVQRFRPNLVIDTGGDASFPEDAWVGGGLALGDARIRIDERDPRCVMINIDPASGERDPAVLRAVAQQRAGCIGVYGSTVTPGIVRVGDPVLLEQPAALAN